MIDLIAAAGIGGIIGFGICAFLTMGKLADANDKADWELTARCLSDDLQCVEAAHTRCADALSTCQAKLEAVREQLRVPDSPRKWRLWEAVGGRDS